MSGWHKNLGGLDSRENQKGAIGESACETFSSEMALQCVTGECLASCFPYIWTWIFFVTYTLMSFFCALNLRTLDPCLWQLVFPVQSFLGVESTNELKIQWRLCILLLILGAEMCSCQGFSSVWLQNRNFEARHKIKSSLCNSCFPERSPNQPEELMGFRNIGILKISSWSIM